MTKNTSSEAGMNISLQHKVLVLMVPIKGTAVLIVCAQLLLAHCVGMITHTMSCTIMLVCCLYFMSFMYTAAEPACILYT